jgi:hypothetical protein
MSKFSLPGANRAFQQLLWCLLTAVALASCGGGGGTPGTASAAAVPIINGTPPTTVEAGEKYQYLPSVSNASGGALSYEIVNKPGWATFDEANGELSGTPDEAEVGLSAEIQINVSNAVGSAIIGPFRIRIMAHKGPTTPYTSQPGAPPTIAGAPAASIAAGQSYSFVPTVNNPGGEPLTFAIANRPAWATFNTANGALTGIPTTASEGTCANIQISVTAGTVTVSLTAFSITVTAPATNAPLISGTPGSWVESGSQYSFTPSATDPQGLALTFSIANAPAWATFNPSTGQLVGTPTAADAGTWGNILISVSDGTQSASLPAFSIQVQTPGSGGDTPNISGTPPTSIVAGNEYAFTPSASDPEGSALTFAVTNLPAWATFNPSTGELSGAPGDAAAGNYRNIVISVSNGSASAALPAFAIQVSLANVEPPVISGTPPTSAVEGSAYTFTPSASDPEGNPLTFSVTNLPSWASFSSASGKLAGTPSSANAGTFRNIVISVSDGSASASLAPFSITVSPPASGNAMLGWNPPTQNTNGTPLTNLAGYHIYYGTSPNNLASSVQIADANTTSYTINGLAAGTWYFSINAYTSAGVESAISNVASKTIP